MSENIAIQVQNLHKDFGEVYAVKGLRSKSRVAKFLVC